MSNTVSHAPLLFRRSLRGSGDMDGFTPLHSAVSISDSDLDNSAAVRALLECGADANGARDEKPELALGAMQSERMPSHLFINPCGSHHMVKPLDNLHAILTLDRFHFRRDSAGAVLWLDSLALRSVPREGQCSEGADALALKPQSPRCCIPGSRRCICHVSCCALPHVCPYH